MTYVNLESNSSFQPDQPLDFYLNTSLSGENLFCKLVCDTMGHIALPVGQGNGDEVLQPVSNVPQKSPKEKLSVLGLTRSFAISRTFFPSEWRMLSEMVMFCQ